MALLLAASVTSASELLQPSRLLKEANPMKKHRVEFRIALDPICLMAWSALTVTGFATIMHYVMSLGMIHTPVGGALLACGSFIALMFWISVSLAWADRLGKWADSVLLSRDQ
jgi:hypothetical protein